MPRAGSVAPDFHLPSQEGALIRLSQFRGKWVVLYFYPKDQTRGCTLEAHNFEVDQANYEKRNAVVLGVNLDSVDSHKRFCINQSLSFNLLADPDRTTTKAYGSLLNLVVVKLALRRTFIIDPTGKIAKVFASVDPGKHSAEVLSALDALQRG
jgi:peroxiredoxin Q/BCP